MRQPHALMFCLLAGTLLALSTGCSRERSTHLSADEAGALLVDRNWLDRWPQSKDERLRVYRFVPAMGNSGVFQDRTLFLGQFELFLFQVEGDTIVFHMPDSDETLRSRFRIETVSEPAPFDLRLTLEASPRGPSVYHGIRSETASSWHELDALLPGPQH